jgi:hypothetical protein
MRRCLARLKSFQSVPVRLGVSNVLLIPTELKRKKPLELKNRNVIIILTARPLPSLQ